MKNGKTTSSKKPKPKAAAKGVDLEPLCTDGTLIDAHMICGDKGKTAQTVQPNKKVLAPKAAEIDVKKKTFLKALRKNGGNISKALETSKLARNTAYKHLKNDPAFAESWVEANEAAADELLAVGRERAINGKDDRMLIFMIRHTETKKKWRSRVIQTGNLALKTILTAGADLGMTPEQIQGLREKVTEAFEDIPLI